MLVCVGDVKSLRTGKSWVQWCLPVITMTPACRAEAEDRGCQDSLGYILKPFLKSQTNGKQQKR